MVNWKKSDLKPSTHLQYFGMVIHISQAGVSVSRSSVLLHGGSHIFSTPSFSASADVAATSQAHVISGAISLGGGGGRETRMQPLQWQMKDNWLPMGGDPGSPIHLLRNCIEVVQWWFRENRWTPGGPLKVTPPSLLLCSRPCRGGGHIFSI